MKLLSNLFNFLLTLLLTAFLTVLLLAPSAIGDLVAQIENVVFPVRLGIVLVMYLLLLLSWYIQLRFRPTKNKDMLLVRGSGADTGVTVESTRERILKSIGAVPSVSSVTADLKSINGKAEIALQVITTDDNVNIPEKQKEINRALEQVIKKQLGLQMASRPKINIQLGTAPKPAEPTTSFYVPPMSTPEPVVAPPPVYTPVTPAPIVPEVTPEELPSVSDSASFVDDSVFSDIEDEFSSPKDKN